MEGGLKKLIGKKVIIEQVRSTNRSKKNDALTLTAMGLGKIGSKREVVISSMTAGMIGAVRHLVVLEEIKK